MEATYKNSQERHDRERLLTIRIAQRGGKTLADMAELVDRGRATMADFLLGGVANA